jgi:DNA-binding NarL/FixJ family response regulator
LHFTAGLVRYAVHQGIVEKEFGKDLPKHDAPRGCGMGLNRELTARETEVLKLIADGMVSKQIASELNISIKTVDNHRQNLMKRLDIHEVAGLTRYAIAKRIVPDHPVR